MNKGLLFRKLCLLTTPLLIVGCPRRPSSDATSPLQFQGPAGHEAVIYRVVPRKNSAAGTLPSTTTASGVAPVVSAQSGSAAKEFHYSPLLRVSTGSQVMLEPGRYFIANACSGYAFEHLATKPSTIHLGRLELVLQEPMVELPLAKADKQGAQGTPSPDSLNLQPLVAEATPAAGAKAPPVTPSESPVESDIVHTQCIDPVDGQLSEWRSQTAFDILPGETQLLVGGRALNLKNPIDRSELFRVALSPVRVRAPESGAPPRYFASPEESAGRAEGNVISVSAGSTLWLLPGNYHLEVNGTRRKVKVDKTKSTDLSLGVLRIEMPLDFPLEARLRGGGQPIFAYIGGGVLFNLNTDYLVFPGDYLVSIEGSEVRENYLVEEDKRTVVQTLGAQIDVPQCPAKFKSCKSSPKVTIHKDQHPYPLMIASSGMPFLVLDGKYEYGVEGTRGVLRDLSPARKEVHKETLGRLKLVWEVKQIATRARTDLVRIETRGLTTFGRSLDLLFNKPDEVYLPAGQYQLTYFIGDPQQERTKSKIDFSLNPGETREVIVPIYTGGIATRAEGNNTATSAGNSSVQAPAGVDKSVPLEKNAPSEAAPRLPSSLVPIRR